MSEVWLVRVSYFNDEGSPDVAVVAATQEGARRRVEGWAKERALSVQWTAEAGGLLMTLPSTIGSKKPRPIRTLGEIDLEKWEVIE